MKKYKVFLLLTLTLLLLGFTYAADDNIIVDDTVVSEIESTDSSQEIVGDKIISEEPIDNKEINKLNMERKTSKTISQNIDVNDFNTLHNILTSAEHDTLTLNIKSDIKLTNNTKLNNAITNLTINGNGKTIDGVNSYSFLNITAGIVTISNITIINCYSDYGGAIFNNGTLTITDSLLQNNNAENNGGAIFNDRYCTLTIINSTLQNNNAKEKGGAIFNDEFCTLTIINSTLQNNNAEQEGGAIQAHGDVILVITNSTLQNNSAEYGGAIHNYWFDIFTITGSTLQNNSAKNGGAINMLFGIISNITNSTLNNNNAFEDGGAIFNGYYNNLSIINTTLNNNSAEYGGAIYSDREGTLTTTNTTLNNNSAEYGGAICNMGTLTITNTTLQNNNAEENGGAIYNSDNLTITNSALNSNNALGDGGAIFNSWFMTSITNTTLNSNNAYCDGGAIYNKGSLFTTNTTLNSNNAYGNGGAIYNQDLLTITNSTIDYNDAKKDGGAVYNTNILYINNSVFVNNSDETIYSTKEYTFINSTINNQVIITIDPIKKVHLDENIEVSGSFKEKLLSKDAGGKLQIAFIYDENQKKIIENNFKFDPEIVDYCRSMDYYSFGDAPYTHMIVYDDNGNLGDFYAIDDYIDEKYNFIYKAYTSGNIKVKVLYDYYTFDATHVTIMNTTNITVLEKAVDGEENKIDNDVVKNITIIDKNNKINPHSFKKMSKGSSNTIKYYAPNKTILKQGSEVILSWINNLFNNEFNNKQILIYIDDILVYNGTVSDDSSEVLFSVLEKYKGEHILKIVEANNTYQKTVTII